MSFYDTFRNSVIMTKYVKLEEMAVATTSFYSHAKTLRDAIIPVVSKTASFQHARRPISADGVFLYFKIMVLQMTRGENIGRVSLNKNLFYN